MNWLLDLPTLVKVLGVTSCVFGIALCYRLIRVGRDSLSRDKMVNLRIASISALTFNKLLAFMAFIVVAGMSVSIANYHVFSGVKEVRSCNSCHVMRPMVNDMTDPSSETLAARHFSNKWISSQQCYTCHTDYGLAGTLKAKMDGYRHLARYTTGTYTEPIASPSVYNTDNCMQCHAGTRKFEMVSSHIALRKGLSDGSLSCLNCHGSAHPTRAQRTPGHPDYNDLMKQGD
ncbi:MAG: hypothetical protein IH851_00810 [Armatimonadetes bacterium]|nr:hypothetical protein [Armatimonadota bacterium]